MNWSTPILEAALRLALLGLLAAPALVLLRRHPAAWRHTVYLVLLAAIPALPLLQAFAPQYALTAWWRQPAVLAPIPELPAVAPVAVAGAPAPAAAAAFDWTLAAAALYALFVLAGLAHLLLRIRRAQRLAASSELILDPRLSAALEAAAATFPVPEVRASAAARVPFTVGWLRPVVILPANWPEWEPFQLQAVLAHELAHVTRADWATSILAAANRALFFAHPLAWWVERRLAALAEEACDEAALAATGDARRYAGIVLSFAWALQGAKPQAVTAMARSSKVGGRIEKILEGSMPLAHSLSSRGRVLLVMLAAAAPLIYAAAAVSLEDPAPVQAPGALYQKPGSDSKPAVEYPGMRLSAPEAEALRARLLRNPHDLEARGALLGYYFTRLLATEWKTELFWLVQNHPEAAIHDTHPSRAAASRGLLTNDADFGALQAMWRAKAIERPADLAVQLHAAHFFQSLDAEQAWSYFEAALRIDPSSEKTLAELRLFLAPRTFALRPQIPQSLQSSSAEFAAAQRWVERAEATNNPALLGLLAQMLLPHNISLSQPLPAEYAGRLEHLFETASRLLARARQLEPANPRWPAVEQDLRASADYVRQAQSSTAPVASVSASAPPPAVLHRVEPVYPPLARQARIAGTVVLEATIGADGNVANLQLVSGHPLLVQAALDAARQWRFDAASLAGRPATRAILEMNFRPEAATTEGRSPLAPAQPDGPIRTKVVNDGKTVTTETTVNGQTTITREPSGLGAIEPVRPSPPSGPIPLTQVPRRITVGGNVQQALLVEKPAAVYPPLARQARIEGNVVLIVVIAEDGTVKHIALDSGHPLLVQAAVDAVKLYRYRVTRLNGQPVEVGTRVEVPFRLDEAPPVQ